MEIDRGLRVRLAPQGITGTNYLEIDYVDPKANPVLPITWTPNNLYIPSAQSTVTAFIAAASDIMARLQKLDLEGTLANVNKLLVTTNSRIDALDTAKLTQSATRVMDKVDRKLDQLAMDKIGSETRRAARRIAHDQSAAGRGARRSCAQAAAADADAALVQLKKTLEDPNLAKSIAHLQSTLSRLDRLTGSGEADLKKAFDNLRQLTENLRDLSENAKRYPSQLLLGAPPPPAKGLQP